MTISFDRQNQELSTARLLLDLFGEGQPHFARAGYDGNNVSYRPANRIMELSDVNRHLQGELTLGAYQLLPDSTVRWMAWDFDSPVLQTAKDMASKVHQVLDQNGIQHAVEFSGSKGYHIFIFLQEPVPAEQAKLVGEAIREQVGLPAVGTDHVEVFPKQEALTSTNPYGNLIKLPLGQHPRTHNWSKFVDPNNGWESGQDIDPIIALQGRADFIELKAVTDSESDPSQQIASLLAPLWAEGHRHELALSLAGYLASVGWGMEKTLSVIEVICEMTGDTDAANRLDATRDTFATLNAGKPVVGMTRLQDLLPGSVIRTLAQIATKNASPDSVRYIDAIRTQPRVPTFLKVRSAAAHAWSYLGEHGRILQTPDGSGLFWFNSETHHLLNLDSIRWEAFLADAFGVNLKDSFSAQMNNDIKLRFVRDARKVEVHRRSFWDGRNLYVHLDGEHVYLLDGDSIQVVYNGESDIMFDDLGTEPTELDTELPRSDLVWEMLTDEISFTRSMDAPASPVQQREMLKAWMLSFFFPQLMATRPILCCLGAAGSGKTTAMRRLLWVYEDPHTNVLELVTDKADALRSSMTAHKLLVLDNLEKTTSAGLVDVMNRMATGSDIEMRKLYTTNEVMRLKPDVFLAVTAVNLPFSEETLFSRLLPIELERLANPRPEHALQKELRTNRSLIWMSILHQLNDAIRCLRSNSEKELTNTSRLADYVMFAQRMQGHPSIEYDSLIQGLSSMVNRQLTLLRHSSSFVEILEIWVRHQPAEAVKNHTAQDLWNVLKPMAKSYDVDWSWNSSRTLETHIQALSDNLAEHYGMHTEEVIQGGKTVTAYRFDSQTQLM